MIGIDPAAGPRRAFAGICAAAAFLTRVPAPAGGAPPAAAAGYFPLVGAAVGAAGAAVASAALWAGLGPWLAAVFAVAAQIALTGGLHEDGLADAADGFGGAADREARLAIMRDSAVGAYGVLALALMLAARVGAVAALAAAAAWPLAALAAAGAASRAAMVAAMRGLPPARVDGLAAAAGRPGRGALALALATAAACAAPLGGAGAAALAAGVALGAAAVARLAMRRIGGATGDVYGAIQTVGETAGLCALAAVAGA